VALIVETGEAREVHHMCVLIGYGVDAICPYMVFEIAHMLRKEQLIDPEITDHVVYENYAAAVDRGISKVRRLFGILFLFYQIKKYRYCRDIGSSFTGTRYPVTIL
jgi:glutamate synthase (NADPH/NADH)